MSNTLFDPLVVFTGSVEIIRWLRPCGAPTAGGIRASSAYVVPACLFFPTGKIGAKADVAWLLVDGVGRKLYGVAFIEKTS